MRIPGLAALLAFLIAQPASALVPHQIPVQGSLATSSGLPVAEGSYSFTFRILNDSLAGGVLWPGLGGEEQSVSVNPEGLWQAYVGALEPLPDTLFRDSLLWLEITVDDGTTSETLSRVRLGAGAYAFESVFAGNAGEAARLGGLAASDFALSEHGHAPADVTNPVQVGDAVGNGFITAPAFEGVQMLDLHGRLTQAFATTPGSLYIVTFAYTDHPVEPANEGLARG